MKNQELWDFCNRCTTENTNDLGYLRVRLGKTRRGAQTVSSKIPVGEDVYSLAEQLEGRLASLRPNDEQIVFVEFLESGSSKVSDTYIHEEEQEDEEEYYPHDVGVLVKTIERLSISADQRANASQLHMIRLFERLIESRASNAMLETLITTADDDKHESVLSQVMTVLEPMIPALLGQGRDPNVAPLKDHKEAPPDQGALQEPDPAGSGGIPPQAE